LLIGEIDSEPADFDQGARAAGQTAAAGV